ncbi:hypothetical protein ACFWIY_15065 [Streptomyces sioyaensis]|uniref:hypothetical protein n=1 Tax=Streptomyces sioyaensis TaxID=67364 RepID=UPI00364F2CBA
MDAQLVGRRVVVDPAIYDSEGGGAGASGFLAEFDVLSGDARALLTPGRRGG